MVFTEMCVVSACDEGPGICAHLITFFSIVLVLVTIPFSLCFAVKVVQEYERVVIFRLGRLLSGGARGPGIFFIVPCVDSYQKVDMRTLTFDVPPQEVSSNLGPAKSGLYNRLVSLTEIIYCIITFWDQKYWSL